MSQHDDDMTAAAFRHEWIHFSAQELGDFDGNHPDVIGNVELFTIASDGQPICEDRVVVDPDDPEEGFMQTGSEAPTTETRGKAIIRSQEATVIHEPVDISELEPDSFEFQMSRMMGIRRGVQMARFIVDQLFEPVDANTDPVHTMNTMDGIHVVDMNTEPPTILSTMVRPEVTSTLDMDNDEVVDRQFTDLVIPTFDQLLSEVEEQRQYRHLLGMVCTARGIQVAL